MGNFNLQQPQAGQVAVDPGQLAQQIAAFSQFQAQQAAANMQQAQYVPQQVYQQPVVAAQPQAIVQQQPEYQPDYQAVLAQLALSQPAGSSPLTLEDVQEKLQGMHEAVAKRLANPIELAKFANDMISGKQGANAEAGKYRKENDTLKAELAEIKRKQQESEMTALEAANARAKAQEDELARIKAESEQALAKQYETEIKYKLALGGCQKPDYYTWKLKDHIRTLEDHEVQALNVEQWIQNEKLSTPGDFGLTQPQVQQQASAPLAGQFAPQFQTPQVPQANHAVHQVPAVTEVQRQTQSFAGEAMAVNLQQSPQMAQQQMQQQMVQAIMQQQAQQAAAQQAGQQFAYQQPGQLAQTGQVVTQVPANNGQQIVTRVADVSKSGSDIAQRDYDLAAFKAANGM